MDVATLTARLKTRFRDPNENVITSAEWLSYLNDAYRDVQAYSNLWSWLEVDGTAAVTVPAATRSVALPADVTRVTAVHNTTDDVLMAQFDGRTAHFKFDPEQNVSGVPEFYRLYAGKIQVYPLPTQNTVLHIEYPAPVADLTTGEPAFPEQYHTMLVEGALARAYLDDGASEQAAAHQSAFLMMLERMLSADLASRHDTHATIVDTWWE